MFWLIKNSNKYSNDEDKIQSYHIRDANMRAMIA